MPVLPANNPEDVFLYLSDNPTIINGESWYLRTFQHSIVHNLYSLRFEGTNTKYIPITIKEEQLVSARDLITLIRETLRSSIVSSMNQQISAMDEQPEITKFVEDFLKPAGRNSISMETIMGTPSGRLHVNHVQMQQVPRVGDRVTATISNTTQGETKMDTNTMLAYIVSNTDKITKLIYKWGTEDSWETDSIIMIDYTYVKDVVFKKHKVVDACGEEVKVYTATVFKAKNGKWYSSLQNNNLHGVEFSDVINFFENSVVVINARSFERDKGSTFIYKGQASD